MDDNQMEGGSEIIMMKFLEKLQKIEAQKHLLETTLTNQKLLNSRILSSLQPKIGRKFNYEDLESKKEEKLNELRKELLSIAMEEKNRDLMTLRGQLVAEKHKLKSTHSATKQKEVIQRLEEKSATTASRLNKKMNKKVSFYLQERSEINFTRKKKVRMKTQKQPQERKKKNRHNYRRNKKKKKEERMKEMITKIKDENVVVNLSDEEIPDCAYIYLAKGLGFVPSQKVDIQDLRYDTLEFIRKVEWRAFFHQQKEENTENTEIENTTDNTKIHHSDIRVSNLSKAPFQHPVTDDLKLRLMGWIANHNNDTPKSNLTKCELQGKKWLEEKVDAKTVFVTKADKGGAILVMNYVDVEEAITNEILDVNKFEEIQTTADDHLFTVRNKINETAINLQHCSAKEEDQQRGQNTHHRIVR